MGGSRKIEMHWVCSRCGTRNLGRDKVCPSCGDPKDQDETFLMPDDPGRAPTVTDPGLLKKATAGKDWTCAQCGAHVSALATDCTQCAAPRPPETRPPPPPPAEPRHTGRAGPSLARLAAGCAVLAAAGVLLVVIVAAVVVFTTRPRDVPVVVDSHHWSVRVAVERWAVRDREGFAEQRPQEAFDVRALGSRHHHDAQVLDHHRTEHYTERVQDGFETERYTERVECGEDCRDIPETCHETCRSDDNGFATCTETCSGGGQTCTTRYCNEDRTRQVPRYVNEDRTRQVPVFRSEPRFAEAYAWHVWDWAPERTLEASGDDAAVAWPDPAPPQPLADGEQERVTRSGTWQVVFLAEDGRRFDWRPADEAAFAAFAPGSAHVVRARPSGTEILALDPP